MHAMPIWRRDASLNQAEHVCKLSLTESVGKRNVAMMSPDRMTSDIPYTASTHRRMELRSGRAKRTAIGSLKGGPEGGGGGGEGGGEGGTPFLNLMLGRGVRPADAVDRSPFPFSKTEWDASVWRK
jgi:hypothetical protein